MKRTSRFKTLLAAACAGLALSPFGASAFIIDNLTSPGDTFEVKWELENGATDPNGNTNNTGTDITGSAVFEFLGWIDNKVDLQLTLTNTTAANDDEIGLYRFGFSTDPDAELVSWEQVDGDSNKIVTVDEDASPALSNAAGTLIEVEANTGPGANKTLQAGEFDTFKLTLSFLSLNATKEVEFKPFAAFYQSDPDSFQIPGSNGTGPGGGDNPVPVPGTLALLGLGILLARRQLKA